MGARTFGAFVAGFAAGVLLLGGALWSSGSLRSTVMPPWLRTKASATLPAPPAILTAGAQMPGPPVPPPEGTPGPPSSQGSAERTAPEPGVIPPDPGLRLTMPIVGTKPSTLSDTFHEMRDGHEHEAVDILASRNTPVQAVSDGTIVKLFTSKEGGLTVYQFDPSGQYCFYYAHLDHYPQGLQEGAQVKAGDVVGFVGTTGDAPPDTPHLHFAVFKLGPDKKWWQGTALNPVPMLK
jgi:murein DD-endopeptidase MepM/ murein hydrolase activator NlpD